MTSSRRVVLYYPERGDPKLGQPYSADLIPLEFLHICAPAMEAGFEFDIIDSMVEPDPMGKLWKKLPGAMAFGSTCIVGYQVADGTEVARQVREKYPQLPIIWGGWFPSVAPELFLRSNLADAVCLGQGELTFRDWLIAVRDGKPFDDIPGMALWRDGKLHKTPWREVVSLDDLPPPRFDLIDVDQYLEIQERQASTAKVRYRFPDPPGFDMHHPYRALSYFSSYGCPEPCSFCCSPMVTQRRWKALAAETLVDRIEELKRTHEFDVLRFQDANFGVHEKRTREFARLLVERKLNIWWNASIEVETIVKFSDETLDLLAESGCHMMWVGAETASAEMQAYIRKGIQEGNVDIAMRRMYERGISIGLFWIIGYPDETEESMRATLTLAAEIKTRYPSCTSEVLLYRPMPGTESGDHAARNGYEMPLEFETWGSMVDYKFANRTFEQLPPSIKRDYHRYTYLVPWFDGLVRGKTVYHRFLRAMAGWRLRHQIYDWTLEFKAYDIAKRIGRSMGLVRGPKLENRAAGVSIEGTTHNVRDAAAMPNS